MADESPKTQIAVNSATTAHLQRHMQVAPLKAASGVSSPTPTPTPTVPASAKKDA
ncbi:hypothetical protein [Brevundimonas sp.]|uniref:hypothetical protein n=1 Tax=Brevundimonas sp. TaxID=1871086 RepID=UPI0025C04868|nr:hypothetical protein [Brevundimonas sp.]